jgi:hypothetical protein
VPLKTVKAREKRQLSGCRLAASAIMILHDFRANSPVVTDTGCCPSAAHPLLPSAASELLRLMPRGKSSCESSPASRWRRSPSGASVLILISALHLGLFLHDRRCDLQNDVPLETAAYRSVPLGCANVDQAWREGRMARSRPVADAFGAPVFREEGLNWSGFLS